MRPAEPELPVPPTIGGGRRRFEEGAGGLVGAGLGAIAGTLVEGASPLMATMAGMALMASPTLALAGAAERGLVRLGAPELLSDSAYNLVCAAGFTLALATGLMGGGPCLVVAGAFSGARLGSLIQRQRLDSREEDLQKTFRRELPRLRREQWEAYKVDLRRYEQEKAEYDARSQVWRTHRPERATLVDDSETGIQVGSVRLKRRN